MMRFINTKLRTVYIECVSEEINCMQVFETHLTARKTLGLHLGTLDNVLSGTFFSIRCYSIEHF